MSQVVMDLLLSWDGLNPTILNGGRRFGAVRVVRDRQRWLMRSLTGPTLPTSPSDVSE